MHLYFRKVAFPCILGYSTVMDIAKLEVDLIGIMEGEKITCISCISKTVNEKI
jgi:hypothetical protein